MLVTGSNMSGKTTFLRTIGVNLLMAQCGLPVCAASWSFTPMALLTSLRISDSLQEQTSYFMAELKKLRNIVHRLDTGIPALVLIDEILRGTNSEDKTHGSELFIRKLIRYNCLSLFATHDLLLGQLEEEMPDKVRNYCFESVIDGENLHFNYQLQRGVSAQPQRVLPDETDGDHLTRGHRSSHLATRRPSRPVIRRTKKPAQFMSGRYADHNLTLTLSVTETGNNSRISEAHAPAIATHIPHLQSSERAFARVGQEFFRKSLFYLGREIFQDRRFHLHFTVHDITIHNLRFYYYLKNFGATTENEKRKHRCEKFNRPCLFQQPASNRLVHTEIDLIVAS
ncbi:MutS-related protein [Puia sp. P3]|uniref:MutS-related protein n=1 Tax=Puia sp. P3 TaxID=3423952 RepID=UPI003D670F0F